MGNSYTESELKEIIDNDDIVVAACPNQKMPALHGKFIAKDIDGQTQYCFCPFKKGLSFSFRPAQDWQHGDAKDAALGVAEALMKGRKGLTG